MNCFDRQKTGGKHPTKHFHVSIGIPNNCVCEASSRPESRHLVIRRRFPEIAYPLHGNLTLSPSNMQMNGQGVVRLFGRQTFKSHAVEFAHTPECFFFQLKIFMIDAL